VTAVPDVAYLDAPYVEHVPRASFLLRMSVACWEDACHDCTGWCACGCHDDTPRPVRCARCGYLTSAPGHAFSCEPGSVTRRLYDLAAAIGGRR
jgi:hypothetical protein